jgi:hypothetical protein
MGALVDMRAMLVMEAVNAFVANPDSLFSHGKNAYYRDTLTGQLRMYFPWDLDSVLRPADYDIYERFQGRKAKPTEYQTAFLTHPTFRAEFDQIMRDLLDGPFQEANLHAFLDSAEQLIASHVDADPNNNLVRTDAGGRFNTIRRWTSDRIANVRSQLGDEFVCGDGACQPGEDVCSCSADCGPAPAIEVAGETCQNGLDDDCDGDLDCSDPDCSTDVACASSCGDGTCDADEDPCSCADCGTPPALEVDCSDGLDDDCDGLVDGADEDCQVAAPACVPGDIEPDGVGDGDVDLADWSLAKRKNRNKVAINDRDTTCGDVDPGAVACSSTTPARWCAAGDGAFDRGDTDVIRKLANGTYVNSCVSCSGQVTAADLRIPGDVAPRGDLDGRVTISDVVTALRWAAGAGAVPTDEETLRCDVAPSVRDGGLLIAQGDGRITIGDVVVILRASARAEQLAWPERRLAANVDEDAAFVALSVTTTGWPAWAQPLGAETPGCTLDDGIDVQRDRWSVTCASDPDVLVTPADIVTFVYRAPEPVAPGQLNTVLQLVDEDLATIQTTARLEAR